MGEFLELFQYPFMQRAIIAAALTAGVCSAIGVFVVLRGLAFVGVGISHSAFAGVALGALIGISPLFGAAIFCSLVAVGIGHFTRRGRFREDTAIGIFFAASMALGLLLMDIVNDPGLTLSSVLFGSVISLSGGDLFLSFFVCIGIILLLVLFYKEFQVIVFDEELAYLNGLAVNQFFYLLLVAIALCVVISVKLVGSILGAALLVTPAATALLLARDFDRVLLLSVLIGIGTAEVGLVLSYFLDVAPSASITLLEAVIFLGVWVAVPRAK